VIEMVEILIKFAREFWLAVSEMAPYLLFGFFMAGVLSVLVSQETVERHIGRRGLLSVFKASMFGVPLPLCSCGVIPVGMSLRRHGASRDASVAFLISTPQTGVDSIMVTLSMLGPVFAVVRPVAALLTGMFGGMLTYFFGPRERDENGDEKPAPACTDACCAPSASKSLLGKLGRAVKYGFGTLPSDIGRFLIVGLLIAGGIAVAVPHDFFKQSLGAGIVPMLVMMAVGIPMYVCSSASVPVAAALIHAGITPGAALVFLMTGPATNAATITTLWKVLGRRTAVLYLAAIASGALAFGLLLDFFTTGMGHHISMTMPWMMPQFVNNISAVVLLAILLPAFFRKKSASAEKSVCESGGGSENVQRISLRIGGMTCSHCVDSVTRALSEFSGVRSVKVDLNPGRAEITGEGLDREKLSAAVEQLGYKVENVSV